MNNQMFEKPCFRPAQSDGTPAPGCKGVVRKAERGRLNAAKYCCLACASQHRLEIGGHPFQLRTPETILANAAKAGRTRGERAKRRKLLDIAARLEKFLPPEWEEFLLPEHIARIKVLFVRAYQEGHQDGYQAGHTSIWRHTRRKSRRKAA